MVKVCDAIMGTGKSQSAITYMNEHAGEKFIYITPYLEEANRIKLGCPSLHFAEPSSKFAQYHYRKTEHTADLVSKGRNITTTHQAFKSYTPELLKSIKEQGYTLIIDENVDVLESFEFQMDDLQIAIDAGYVSENNGTYSLVKDVYKKGELSELFRLLKARDLMRVKKDAAEVFFYWVLPPELITSFKDVFILTYLFEGQSLHHFLEIYHIPYEYIGITPAPDAKTGFRFSKYPGYTPEYVAQLKDKLHIIDGSKLNNIGDDYYALSMNHFKNNEEETQCLKKNIYNCFRNIWGDGVSDKRLCGTYKKGFAKIKGKGYTRALLPFNTKATNAYRDKTHLIYAANIFMNVSDKLFYQAHGIEVDEDMYALSIMVQWIWRSAIRDGKEIYLYIPSSRMRNMLIDWIDTVSKGGNNIA